MSFESFCDELNESPWMGAVCEVGIGIPFQSAYVNHPGASRTILFTQSPYSKAFQPNDIGRSVSHEMASRYAWDNYWKCLKNERTQNDHLFSVAVSASHKMGAIWKDGKRHDERGQSHGWVSIVACKDSKSEPKAYSFHWRLNKTKDNGNCANIPMDRGSGGEIVADHIAWFLKKILLDEWDSWKGAIKNLPNQTAWREGLHDFGLNEIWIDVIRAPEITMEEHLMLARPTNPLVYHNREFKRPADYIRRYSWCYRGSFNPVTISHESIGNSSMFELSIDNARKGKVTIEQLAHRIRMIDLVERPTIITSGVPLFVDLHKELLRLDAGSMEYLVGLDTFNAVIDEKYIDTDNEKFFADFEWGSQNQSARFIVLPRDSTEVKANKYSDKIGWRIADTEHPNISSSAVRAGDLTMVSEKVKKYIEEHRLYAEESSTIKQD